MSELETLSKLKRAGKLHYWRWTIEIDVDELHEICDEIQAEHDKVIVEIAHARTTIDTLRARYGKGETKLTDDQIAGGLEHYRPKNKIDITVIDELRGDM